MSDAVVNAVERVCDQLKATQIRTDIGTLWPLGHVPSWSPRHATSDVDLYEGAAGVSLFLVGAGSLTSDPDLFELARRGAAYSVDAIARRGSGGLSLFAGRLGISRCALEVADRVGDEPLRRAALDLLVGTESWIGEDVGLDVISGVAGIIPMLVDAAGRYAIDWALDAAVAAGDRILRMSEAHPFGRSWPSADLSRHRNLTGFGHGTSGFANALLVLSTATGHDRFAGAAAQAFAYEEMLRDSDGNWLDARNHQLHACLRSSAQDDKLSSLRHCSSVTYRPTSSVGWCYGQVGFALARLDTGASSPEFLEASRALQRVGAASDARSGDPTLVRGAAGILDVLVSAAHRHQQHGLRRVIDNLANELANRLLGEQGELVNRRTGMMEGVAGVAYALIRARLPHLPTPLDLFAPQLRGHFVEPPPEILRKRAYATAGTFFAQTLAAFEALGVPDPLGVGEEGYRHNVGLSVDPRWAFNALQHSVSVERSDRKQFLEDALLVEGTAFALWSVVDDYASELLARRQAAIVLERGLAARWTLPPTTAIVRPRWKWEQWLGTNARSRPHRPREGAAALLVHRLDNSMQVVEADQDALALVEFLKQKPRSTLELGQRLKRDSFEWLETLARRYAIRLA